MMRGKLYYVGIAVVVLAILYMAFVVFPANECERVGTYTGQAWYFHPADGCYLQGGNGYYRVDSVTINQP